MKFAVKAVTIVYLLCLGIPATSLIIFPATSDPRTPPPPVFPVIVLAATLISAITLVVSARIGALMTCGSLFFQSFGITTPFVRYYVANGPAAWLSMVVSTDGWHVRPWFLGFDHSQYALSFGHLPTIQSSAFGINLVAVGAAAAIIWVVRSPNKSGSVTSPEDQTAHH